MARMRLTTYQDAIDHLVDYDGAATGDDVNRFARRAVQDAYNKMPSIHNWSYSRTRGRVQTVAPQLTGTIQYTNATFTVVLTGATWPTWVLQGVIVINNIPHQIATNPDAAGANVTITLSPQSNPGADVAAGAIYTLYQDAYSLPIDFTQCDEVMNINFGLRLTFEHPGLWLQMQRIYRSPATPRLYTVMGSTAFMGALSLRFFPPPDNLYFMDFVYKRRARPLSVVLNATGTASCVSGSLTLTGNGTSWDANTMVGSVIRLSQIGNSVQPTGPSGENPFYIERTILAVNSPTSITVDADPAYTGTNLAFAISDPLDIEEGAMLSFFLRLLEKQFRRNRRLAPTPNEDEDYEMALREAKEADNRSSARQAVGGGGYPRRLRDFPSGADQG